ncbi:hypothetical protein IT401_02345 [Candidatus Nomurabacteria bacterium]|nr:hypothetical protein [Candidatus Nomurabacteria bacterium]
MTHILLHTPVRATLTGLITVFVVGILLELVEMPVLFICALAVIVVAILLAKKTAQHFHHEHTHTGDSPLDVVATTVLFLANIFHPAIDGFSAYETFVGQGALAGSLVVAGIILHEAFRQGVLIAAFKDLGIRWQWVLITTFAGMTAGVGLGSLGSWVLHEHEALVDIITVFAYTFIIGEFVIGHRHDRCKDKWWYIVLGLLLGTALTFFFKVH